jgi:hypothetical protein
MNTLFPRIATASASACGRPVTFVLACLSVVIWGASGPLFRYSDTWQLVINTATTVITFLVVFLIQNSHSSVPRRVRGMKSLPPSSWPKARSRPCGAIQPEGDHAMYLVLIVLVLLMVFGGGVGYHSGYWGGGAGYGGVWGGGLGIVGIVVLVLVIALLSGRL